MTGRFAAAVVSLVAIALVTGPGPGAGSSSYQTAAGTTAEPESPPEVFRVFRSDPNRPGEARQAYADMMSIPSVDTGYFPQFNPPIHGGPRACPPRRCVDARLKLPPGVNLTSSMVRVLLPAGYRKKKNRDKRYPVIHLYNGALSSFESWSRKTMLTSMSRSMKAIIVMPEGSQSPVAGMFTDWFDGSYQWETFHIDVVIPWVDSTFRTMPGARAAVGASMGGLAALTYPARHPGLFNVAFSMSGLADNRLLSVNIYPTEVQTAAGFDTPDMKRIWGNPVTNQDVWASHNPAQLADEFQGVKLFISAGTGFVTGRKDDPDHTGRMEHFLWQGHRTFFAALTEAGVPFTARIAQGGIHNWLYFDTAMRWGFPKVIAATRR